MNLTRIYRAVPLALVWVFLAIGSADAQAVPTSTPTFSTTFGNITNLQSMFAFAINLMKYIGWAGVILGIVIVLALLIYKLVGTDDQETMKTVQGGITKAIIIIVIGLLLLSVSFMIGFVAELLNFGTAPNNLTSGP